MSSSLFIRYAYTLLFLAIVETIDSQECGQSSYENHLDSSVQVTGKGIAKEGQFPWMVATTRKSAWRGSYVPDCSGFLIDRRHIISTAHCFYDKQDPELYRARIGNIDEDGGDEYRIRRIVIHDGYTKHMYYNDIAILTLEREVNSSNVNPICLPDEEVSKMNLTDRKVAVVGWKYGNSSGDFDSYLRFGTGLRVISNEQCVRELGAMNSIQELANFWRVFPYGINKDIICIALEEGDSDACVRSGGPLMIENENRWFAVGIASFGSRACLSSPEGYTNVTNYLDWIRQNTKSDAPPE